MASLSCHSNQSSYPIGTSNPLTLLIDAVKFGKNRLHGFREDSRWAKTSIKKQSVKNWLCSKNILIVNRYFFAAKIFMQMLTLYKLCVQSIRLCQQKLQYNVISTHRHYMSHDMTKPAKWVCAQRRLRSAWASAQSDRSLRCPHEESLGP